MGISFGASTKGKLATTSTVTSVTPTLPAGIVAGDIILLWIMTQEGETGGTPGDPSLSPATGWNEIGGGSAIVGPGSFNNRFAVWWKVATGSDTAPTISWSGASQYMWGAANWTGTDSSSVDVSALGTPSTGGTSILSPSLSPTGSNDWRIDLYFGASSTGVPTIIVPGTQNARASDTNSEDFNGWALGDEVLSASGSTGTRTGTGSRTLDQGFCAASLCIKPAGVTPPSGVPRSFGFIFG